MIDIKELRLGNWVLHNNRNKCVILTGTPNLINFSDREVKSFPLFCSCEDIYPIQISEEILLKCGFEVYSTSEDWKYFKTKDEFEILFSPEISEIIVNKRCVKINSLHQLQNIYFEITKRELPIKFETRIDIEKRLKRIKEIHGKIIDHQIENHLGLENRKHWMKSLNKEIDILKSKLENMN